MANVLITIAGYRWTPTHGFFALIAVVGDDDKPRLYRVATLKSIFQMEPPRGD